MIINCPFCGKRDHSEFTYSGDATVKRPDQHEQNSKIWFDYVYQRSNPKGAHQEYWHHTNGCRQFLVVQRNTLTHKISSVNLVTDLQKGDEE